jgi:hypothetical protein
MGRRLDIIGKRFDRLIVIGYLGMSKRHHSRWLCKCNCGRELEVLGNSLTSGNTKSCGCIFEEWLSVHNYKHGHCHTGEHQTWTNMKQRCNNSKRPDFKYYGGRGIKICKRWLKFKNFFADMGEKPADKTLGRIDNDLGYCPENCEWQTEEQQKNNTSNNVIIEYKGERKTLARWARAKNIPQGRLYNRIRRGWTVERALET